MVVSKARPTLIGLPYDASSSFLHGAAEAPRVIREELASPAGNMWSEDFHDLGAPGALSDEGDVDFFAMNPGDARSAIEAGIAAVLADGANPIALGGDHFVTYPTVRAIHAAHGPVTILHIDAHPDLYDEFEGDRYSHACPFARIMDERLAASLVQVGIRAMNGHQREQANRFGVDIFDMRRWESGARPHITEGPVYLSIDLDGIDPAHAPGVSHREPGGLTVRDVIGLVQQIGGTVVGADIVELNPSQDVNRLTARVAAKLVKEVAARMLRA
jgi:arginase